MPTTVSIIDDDPAVLDAVGLLLRTKGFNVVCHDSAAALLNAGFTPGCVITDVRMPKMTGLDLLSVLKASNDLRPIVLLTAHGDIEMAMEAVRLGAFDFIEKPFKKERLLGAVQRALEASAKSTTEQMELAELQKRYRTLTERQKQTMQLLVQGLANKEIAARLGISPRTVEIHRTWAMTKMGAASLADLVRISIQLGTLSVHMTQGSGNPHAP